MSLRKVILHVGTPKTGTTSLQHSLVDHEDFLEENGIRYLRVFRRSLCHNYLTRLAKAGEKDDFIRAKIAAEIEALGPNVSTLLISSETAFGVAATRKILRLLPAHLLKKTTIVFYFRRQDLFLEALAKQKFKNAQTDFDLHSFVIERKRRGAYLSYVDKISAAFPEISIQCHPYERRLLQNGDLVSDFWGKLDLAPPPQTTAEKSHSNKTPSVLLLDALQSFTFETRRHRTLTIEAIADQRPDLMASRDIMDLPTRTTFMEGFRDHNRTLSKLCGHDLEQLFHETVNWETESAAPATSASYETQLRDAKAAIAAAARQVTIS